jgi:hypothetical protein
MRRSPSLLFPVLFLWAATATSAEAQVRGGVVVDRSGVQQVHIEVGAPHRAVVPVVVSHGHPLAPPPHARVKEKYDPRKGDYTYEWKADGCKYKYEVKRGRVEEKFDCKGGGKHRRRGR